MYDRAPRTTDADLEALNDSELMAVLARCQAELGRRAVMTLDPAEEVLDRGTRVVQDILNGSHEADPEATFLQNVERLYRRRYPGASGLTQEDVAFILQFRVSSPEFAP